MPCDCSGMELDVIARYSEMLCYCCKKLSYDDICAEPALYRFYKEHLLMDFCRLQKDASIGFDCDEEMALCKSEIARMGLAIVDGKGFVSIDERQ